MIAVRLLALTGSSRCFWACCRRTSAPPTTRKPAFSTASTRTPTATKPSTFFVPHDYKGDKEYPVILFLHGSGETGADGDKQRQEGIGTAIKKREKTFPVHHHLSAIAETHLVGRLRRRQTGAGDPCLDREGIQGRSQARLPDGPVDGRLRHLEPGTAHPDKWAAIVPICGKGDPKQAGQDQGHALLVLPRRRGQLPSTSMDRAT